MEKLTLVGRWEVLVEFTTRHFPHQLYIAIIEFPLFNLFMLAVAKNSLLYWMVSWFLFEFHNPTMTYHICRAKKLSRPFKYDFYDKFDHYQTLCWWWLIWPVQNDAKIMKND